MPARWVNESIETFLKKHIAAFKKAQQTSSVSNEFMPMILREFLKKFPIPPLPADASPEECEIYDQAYAAAVLKREKQLNSWFYRSGANASSSVNALADLVAPLNKEKTKKKRALTSVQVFSKEFYDSNVKPLVEKELENMRKNLESGKLSQGAHLPVIACLTNEAWEAASESVKAEVEKKRLELLDEDDEEDDNMVDDDDMIDQLPAIVEQFIKSVRWLDWTVSVFIGGMNRRQGQVTTSAFHAGENRAGLSFDESLSDYKERITDPFSAFVKDFYRGLKTQSSQAPISTQSSDAEPASAAVSTSPHPAPLQHTQPTRIPAQSSTAEPVTNSPQSSPPLPAPSLSLEPTRPSKTKKTKKTRKQGHSVNNLPTDSPINPPIANPPIDPSLLLPIPPPPWSLPQLHLQPYNSGPSEPIPMPVDTSVIGNPGPSEPMTPSVTKRQQTQKRRRQTSTAGQTQKRRKVGAQGTPAVRNPQPNKDKDNTEGFRKSGRARQAPKHDTADFIGVAERVRRVTEDN
ncbi:hypothetical protein VKT23_006336 [Stygiomarasmius scandens]|uniref:Uncharacterized protein n=1 Tax=Marasmiellus scandens TaxID=2682957 RepID=A0ABR1JMJ6_9AGAR